MSNLCPHGQNPIACLTCFSAPKAKAKPKETAATVAPKAGSKSVLDRVKERGGQSPPAPERAPVIARPAPKNPHSETGPAVTSDEGLMEFPKHESLIDRLPRRHDT